MAPPDSCPPDDDNLLNALCKKLGCVDLGGAGVYGTSPATFTPCGNIAFFGEYGPVGTGGSAPGDVAGGVEGTGGLAGAPWALCAPGEENFEDMLDSHEFRRDVPGDGDNFGRLPLSVTVFSEDALLEKLGRWGIFRGGVGEGST